MGVEKVNVMGEKEKVVRAETGLLVGMVGAGGKGIGGARRGDENREGGGEGKR